MTSTEAATTVRAETTMSSTAEADRPRGVVEEVGEVTRTRGGVVAGATVGVLRTATSAGTLALAGAGRTRLEDSRGIQRSW